MNIKTSILFFILTVLVCSSHQKVDDVWGFYGHRKINRMAVFTLPIDMIPFYKKHIEYITEHAVDPDKRRYAIKEEAVRHYIDIDHWSGDPFKEVPREYYAAIFKYASVYALSKEDTLSRDALACNDEDLQEFFERYIQENQHEGQWKIKDEGLQMLKDNCGLDNRVDAVLIVDNFSSYGILPYFLQGFYWRLVNAFESGNEKNILKFSAEIGHYIGDAHVPLHTTENYNGELTDQIGIHAFWESRIPELFADESYNYFVGRAEYEGEIDEYIWNVIEESHSQLDSVLRIEKRLSQSFPENQQYCFDKRLERTIRVQCPEFAEAYQNEMKGMVEDRMRDAIKSLGSIWFSAWIEAGSPDLNNLSEIEWTDSELSKRKQLEEKFKEGNIYGREH